MKTAILTVTAALLLTASPAWAQCHSNRYYAPQCRTITRPYCPPASPAPVDPYIPPADPNPGFVEPEPELPAETIGLVSYEVQVQHPINFDWQTVKIFDDEFLASEYAGQIETRYWVLYRSASSAATKFVEGRSLTDARSKANALRRTGMLIQAINPFQVQVSEEGLQAFFDEAADTAATAQAEPAVPNELQPLLGLWEAVTRDADGQLNRILLDLNEDGTAEMTVPTAGGGQVKIEREFAVEDGVFKLANDNGELVLGNVVEAGADKVVLERGGANITFLRP